MATERVLVCGGRDLAVLKELDAACRNRVSAGASEWVRPLDCGGTGGSDHSYRLTKLAGLGLAEARQRSAFGERGSKVYRITDAGRALAARGKRDG